MKNDNKVILKYLKKAYAFSPLDLIKQIVTFLSFLTATSFYEPLILNWLFDVMETHNMNNLIVASIVSILALMLIFILGYYNNTYADLHTFKIMNFLCKDAIKDFRKTPYIIDESYEKGDIFERISSLGIGVIGLIVQILLVVSVTISLCISVVLVGSNSFALFGILLCGYIVNLIKTKIEVKHKVKLENQTKETEARIYTTSHQFIDNIDFYIMNDINETEALKYLSIEKEKYNINSKAELVNATSEAISKIVSCGQNIALALILFTQYSLGLIGVGTIFLLSSLLEKMDHVIKRLFAAIKSLAITVVPINRFSQMINAYPVTDKGLQQNDSSDLITISNVSLVKKDRLILDNINFTLKPNEKVALVGKNGSGKSTLMKIILGLEKSTDGLCIVNGKEPSSWDDLDKTNIAYIPALPRLYSETVYKNIMMSKVGEDITTNLCDDLLEYMPENISGGQKQRCNISRGLNKKPILLLADEPTSNLDNEIAKKAIKMLLSGCDACIITVHDPSLLSDFDRVINMENGKII